MNPIEHLKLLRSTLKAQGVIWISCGGKSMEPTIVLGQRVKVTEGRPQRGDVILFESKTNQLILHRLVFWPSLGRWFWHEGDAPSPLGPRKAHKSSFVGVADVLRQDVSISRFLLNQPKYEWRQMVPRLAKSR